MPVYIPVDFALVRSNWVYRMFDVHGNCLYVGKSAATAAHPDGQQLIQRLAQHLTDINPSHRKAWRHEVSRVDAVAFDTPQEAEDEETRQIRRLSPKYNLAKKLPAGSSTLPGFEW
jgi:excinuclease UvrABC nuclease subunit